MSFNFMRDHGGKSENIRHKIRIKRVKCRWILFSFVQSSHCYYDIKSIDIQLTILACKFLPHDNMWNNIKKIILRNSFSFFIFLFVYLGVSLISNLFYSNYSSYFVHHNKIIFCFSSSSISPSLLYEWTAEFSRVQQC